MKLTFSIIVYCLLVFAILQNALIPALVLLFVFTLRHSALYVIPIAILIDGYFGAFGQVPVFALFAVFWYGFSEILREKLRLV